MRRKFLIALSLLVLLSGHTTLAVFAQSSASPDSRLARFEQVLFGNARSSGTIEDRLAAIELQVLGEYKTGSATARLDEIGKVVNLTSTSPLMPPLAPGTDLAQSEPAAAPAPERKQGRVDTTAFTTPDNSDLVKQGMQRYQEGKFTEAEQIFQRVLADDPQNPDALYNLGALAEQRGDLDSALSSYRLALRVNPQDPQLRGTVEEISLELGRRQAAQDRARAAEAEARQLEARAQAAEARAQAAEDRARADRQFAVQAQRDREFADARRPQKVRRPRVPVLGVPMIRFASGGGNVAPRALGGGGGGSTSLIRRAAGFGLNGARIGLTMAAIHCPKCARNFAGPIRMLNGLTGR